MNEKKKLRRLPKRILSFVLTFVMVLGLLPSMAMAAEENWDSNCVVDGIAYLLDTTTKTAALVVIQDDTLTELNVSTVEYEGVVYTVTDALDGAASGAPVISQILCKHRFRCKIEQNIFKAGAAEAASALPTK